MFFSGATDLPQAGQKLASGGSALPHERQADNPPTVLCRNVAPITRPHLLPVGLASEPVPKNRKQIRMSFPRSFNAVRASKKTRPEDNFLTP